MPKTLRIGGAGLLLTLVLAAPAAAATVTVRVEGATSTLVPETRVTTSAAVAVDKTAQGGTTCEGTTAGGALELATSGDWGGRAYDFGSGPSQSVEVIRGESHVFMSGAYWSFAVNNTAAPVGVCDYVPQEGDELLLFAACEGAPAPTCASGDPLSTRAPATAAPGAAFAVTVEEYTSPFGQVPTRAPSAGATVSGGGVTATTGADGVASMTMTQRGPVTLTATKGGRVRDSVTVCVTDGADGFCGTTRPAEPGAPAAPAAPVTPAAPPCETSGDDGRCGTDDERPAQARITGIEEGQRFTRARAPRELTATVDEDPSGLHAVKLGLSRRHGGRCSVLSGRTDRFRRARCGAHPVFVVGDRAEVSYLLAKRLPRGRYVLDVVAIDGAFNRDALARGRNRIVFTVR